MVNFAETFNRMMQKFLSGCKSTDNYVDDILGNAITWSELIRLLREGFERIRKACLYLDKCRGKTISLNRLRTHIRQRLKS